MALDRPVASVSGRRDWEWNRLQANRRSGDRRPDDTAARTRGDRPTDRDSRERHGADRTDVPALERELEQTERRLQSVITRYERLLAERNRQLTDGTDDDPTAGGLRTALSAAVRWVVSR